MDTITALTNTDTLADFVIGHHFQRPDQSRMVAIAVSDRNATEEDLLDFADDVRENSPARFG